MLSITSCLKTLTTLTSSISSLPMSKLLSTTTCFFRLWQITDCLIICWTFNKLLWSRDFWISSKDIWISYLKFHDVMYLQNVFIFCIKLLQPKINYHYICVKILYICYIFFLGIVISIHEMITYMRLLKLHNNTPT